MKRVIHHLQGIFQSGIGLVGGLLTAVILTAGCGRSDPPTTTGGSDLFPITVQLDWVPEPEHGALYTALALGYFEAEGLAVTLTPGGANAPVPQLVASGRAQVGQYDSTNSYLAMQEGLPLVNIGVVFQHDPSALLFKADLPIRGFADLQGRVVKARPDWAFLPYVKKKYGVDFSLLPQDFGLQELLARPGLIQQGYYTAEPYYAEQQGVSLRYLHVWEAGYDNVNTLITSRSFLEDHRDRLAALLRAYVRGYREYMEGDPGPAHRLILQANPNATADFLEWSRRMIAEGNLAKGDPARGGAGQYGKISPARVAGQIRQLEELGILRPGAVRPEQAFAVDLLEP